MSGTLESTQSVASPAQQDPPPHARLISETDKNTNTCLIPTTKGCSGQATELRSPTDLDAVRYGLHDSGNEGVHLPHAPTGEYGGGVVVPSELADDEERRTQVVVAFCIQFRMVRQISDGERSTMNRATKCVSCHLVFGRTEKAAFARTTRSAGSKKH